MTQFHKTWSVIASLIVLRESKEEQEAILRPKPYTEEEREDLLADREAPDSHATESPSAPP